MNLSCVSIRQPHKHLSVEQTRSGKTHTRACTTASLGSASHAATEKRTKHTMHRQINRRPAFIASKSEQCKLATEWGDWSYTKVTPLPSCCRVNFSRNARIDAPMFESIIRKSDALKAVSCTCRTSRSMTLGHTCRSKHIYWSSCQRKAPLLVQFYWLQRVVFGIFSFWSPQIGLHGMFNPKDHS